LRSPTTHARKSVARKPPECFGFRIQSGKLQCTTARTSAPPADTAPRSWDNRSSNRRCLRYLCNRNDILPAGVTDNRPLRYHNRIARVNRRGEHVGGPPPSLVAARYLSIRAHNEDGALVRQSRGAAAL